MEDNLYNDPPLDDLDRHHWSGRLVRRHATEDRDRQIWNGKTFCEIHLRLQTPVVFHSITTSKTNSGLQQQRKVFIIRSKKVNLD